MWYMYWSMIWSMYYATDFFAWHFFHPLTVTRSFLYTGFELWIGAQSANTVLPCWVCCNDFSIVKGESGTLTYILYYKRRSNFFCFFWRRTLSTQIIVLHSFCLSHHAQDIGSSCCSVPCSQRKYLYPSLPLSPSSFPKLTSFSYRPSRVLSPPRLAPLSRLPLPLSRRL